jgi:two-component system nitrogen regulation response regulator NtrX
MTPKSVSVLVVDDEEGIRRTLRGILEDEGYRVLLAENGEVVQNILEDNPPDLVLLDIWMPGKDGMAILQDIKQVWPTLPVVMISGHGSIELAVRATKLGAYDFIEKPLSLDKVILTIENAMRFSRLEEENRRLRQKAYPKDEITGKSRVILQLREQIMIIAPTSSWVFIRGENGTGKEVVARAIYRQSTRVQAPFVEVNCAAIPEELIESELFGHEKGAFTGATEMRQGKFDMADSGTLFLDEIGDMSLSTQAKILRILQEQKFQRVGGTKTFQVDVRVIAASNKDLEKEIHEGRFREDLYHRINVIPVEVPPLRERREDIPLLVEEFVEEFSTRHGLPRKEFDAGVFEALKNYDWPGNVRELKNMVERLLILSRASRIRLDDLPQPIRPPGAQPRSETSQNLKRAREAFERAFIEERLRDLGGNISKTAEAIGLERSHLHKKIRELGIRVPRARTHLDS